MATASSSNEPGSTDLVYRTTRRKGVRKSVREGPTPIEDIVDRKKERPGQLSISRKSSDDHIGLAGSIELLEYFRRLSHDDSKEEYIDTNYIMALLGSGADLNCVDDYGQTVLHAAARDWNPDVARFLIDHGADINKADNYGRTPIFTAILLDYPEMIEFLASRGANIHKRTNGEKQTTMHYAAKGNAVNSLKMLLKLGASAMAEDYKGRSPLFVAVMQGSADATQFLLDIGCPAAAYDNDGYSAMAHMVEKMPSIALEALSQFIIVNTLGGKKSYYLAPLEFDPKNSFEMSDKKNALQMIVKYKETDLLRHPVMEKLVRVKWKTHARFHILNYFFLNLIYVLLWTAITIASSAIKDPFLFKKENTVVLLLSSLTSILTLASAIEQFILARNIKKSESRWKESQIASLRQDLRYCHPQWPQEREVVVMQINRYTSMLSDYYKNFWIYLDWTILVAVFVWDASRIVLGIMGKMKGLEYTVKISLTVVIFLVWIRFLKACRTFQVPGQFIAILGQVIVATGKFAFLFFIFYVPFFIAFWVMFGGNENGDKIASRFNPALGDAFRTLNDVIYTVWTLTVLVGFPMSALQYIDKTLIVSYVTLYYLVMSVVTLNLFIAFLSNVFSRVYKDAEKYALLERATTILLSETFLSTKKKREVFRYMQDKCFPLTEQIQFRETVNIDLKSPDNTLQKVKNKMQVVTDLVREKKLSGQRFQQSATIREIHHNMKMIEETVNKFGLSIAKIHKFSVEVKKIKRILEPPRTAAAAAATSRKGSFKGARPRR